MSDCDGLSTPIRCFPLLSLSLGGHTGNGVTTGSQRLLLSGTESPKPRSSLGVGNMSTGSIDVPSGGNGGLLGLLVLLVGQRVRS